MEKSRIVIGEDDPSVLKVTTARLEHEGYEVLPASDGEAVLREVETHLPIQLILLDVRMPKLNGYEVCRELKHHVATAQIPVILFTASEAHLIHLTDRCIEMGAADWIKKPFQTKELMSKIHRVLGEEEGHG